MPSDKSTTTTDRYYCVRGQVFEQRDEHDVCACIARGVDAEEIADALNAALENRDRPWVGDGPTVEEAGGESILVRFDGELYWTGRNCFGWHDEGGRLWHGRHVPTGWRPMPKMRILQAHGALCGERA